MGVSEPNGAQRRRNGQNKNARTPTLDSLARDLTKLAREQSLDPVVGRGTEVRRLIQILSRRTKTILS